VSRSTTEPARSGWTQEAFREHERHLWAIAYRMTGSAADADDVVQETFARAIQRPPARLDEPIRPWLARVAVNLARDALRLRRRRRYVGPWLPSPVETALPTPEAREPWPHPEPIHASASDVRYDMHESASYAFLVALEALTARQRAVLLLREVLDYSVEETAEALALSAGNVKTTHHRARRAMRAYDRTRRVPAPALVEETRDALQRFLWALASGDVAAVEACLCTNARALSDGGGDFIAALRPIAGRNRVARFLVGLQKKAVWQTTVTLRHLNGLPAFVVDVSGAPTRWAPRFVLRCDLDRDGAIREVHVIIAPEKLRGLRR
jgi:RNA polymerase sigma-70 factor (ECF subfamily)